MTGQTSGGASEAGSHRRAKILLVEDDPSLADQLKWALQRDHDVRWAGTPAAALEALRDDPPDLMVLDLCLTPADDPEEGFAILAAARREAPETVVVVSSGVEERSAALRAIDNGAHDFIPKPADLDVLRIVAARALRRQTLERENRRLRDQLVQQYSVAGMVGVSDAMQAVFQTIRRVADSPATVLVQGESGTGKELVARALHFSGKRCTGPFMAVHCAALPETMLESELFGHERGAFTGADERRIGRFEAADGGTLFLDEVGCLNLPTQAKLLRVLEQRAVERLGSNRALPVDFRLVAAANEDLAEKVRAGAFREDLYFRLRVVTLDLPPLRARHEDIPLLADALLKAAAETHGVTPKELSPAARERLVAYGWPGNVRELRNLMESLTLLVDKSTIELEHLAGLAAPAPEESLLARAQSIGLKAALEECERELLLAAIKRAGGSKAQAARDLGLHQSQMKYLSTKHGL